MPDQDQHSALNDDELIIRYRRNKDNYWLGILLQRYTLLLLGVAMKYLKDKAAAEDAVQQVFLKTLTRFPEGEIQNFKGWLYILIRNHCLQILRDQKFYAPDGELEFVAAQEDTSEQQVQKEENLSNMEQALKKLNEPQRKTIEMFYLQKQSYQQIMEQTGFSFMQVKSHIQNGKRNLKQVLSNKKGKGKP